MFLHKVYRCFCSRPIIVLKVLCLCFFLISAPTFLFLALSAPQNLFNDAIISVDGHLCSSNLSPLVLGILLSSMEHEAPATVTAAAGPPPLPSGKGAVQKQHGGRGTD
jgi:hypothetical protein